MPLLLNTANKYPIIGVLGPRQAGKTTLVRTTFPSYTYVSLETPDNKEFATKDPRGFLARYTAPVIFDEIQRVPELFSYLQELVDLNNQSGQYILTGSQSFALNEKISQTLAGRIYLMHLPTLTYDELKNANLNIANWYEYAFRGTYPRVWDKNLTPEEWYPSYIQTYLERDVRDIKRVTDLSEFQTFLKLCAGRIGQTLVYSSISNELGVSHNTIRSWISVLEASHLILLLRPYYKNINKRLTKSPKLYFYDTGLAVNLLNITSAEQLETHPLKGNIFENLIISEMVKAQLNKGSAENGYYIRDKTGHEIDYIYETADIFSFVEIKSSKTFNTDYTKGITFWRREPIYTKGDNFLVYTGDDEKTINGVNVVKWNNLDSLSL